MTRRLEYLTKTDAIKLFRERSGVPAVSNRLPDLDEIELVPGDYGAYDKVRTKLDYES